MLIRIVMRQLLELEAVELELYLLGELLAHVGAFVSLVFTIGLMMRMQRHNERNQRCALPFCFICAFLFSAASGLHRNSLLNSAV